MLFGFMRIIGDYIFYILWLLLFSPKRDWWKKRSIAFEPWFQTTINIEYSKFKYISNVYYLQMKYNFHIYTDVRSAQTNDQHKSN